MSSHDYLDGSFEVWPGQQGWFWFVVSPLGGSSIGASPTESEAIADACSAIEQAQSSAAPAAQKCAALRWAGSLACLDHFLRARANA